MNRHLSGLHSNTNQILLHGYTHRGDQRYQYLWVPGSLYVTCYSLICGDTYRSHMWNIYPSLILIHNATMNKSYLPRIWLECCNVLLSWAAFILTTKSPLYLAILIIPRPSVWSKTSTFSSIWTFTIKMTLLLTLFIKIYGLIRK